MANRTGRIVERKRLTRSQFERFVDALPAGTGGRDGTRAAATAQIVGGGV